MLSLPHPDFRTHTMRKDMEAKRQIGRSILWLCIIFLLPSCRLEEDEVQYNFIIHNATETPISIGLSSWGAYHVYIDGMYDSRHKFSECETISPHNDMQFSQIVGGNPNPSEIPSSVVPAWEYITAMKCGGVSIPRSFFTDRANWETSVAFQINGTFSETVFVITPELLEKFR